MERMIFFLVTQVRKLFIQTHVTLLHVTLRVIRHFDMSLSQQIKHKKRSLRIILSGTVSIALLSFRLLLSVLSLNLLLR